MRAYNPQTCRRSCRSKARHPDERMSEGVAIGLAGSLPTSGCDIAGRCDLDLSASRQTRRDLGPVFRVGIRLIMAINGPGH